MTLSRILYRKGDKVVAMKAPVIRMWVAFCVTVKNPQCLLGDLETDSLVTILPLHKIAPTSLYHIVQTPVAGSRCGRHPHVRRREMIDARVLIELK